MGILDFLNTKKSTNQTECLKPTEEDNTSLQLKEELNILHTQKEMLTHTCSQLAITLKQLESDIEDLEDRRELHAYGICESRYNFESTILYKDKLTQIKNQLKQLVKDKKATNHNLDWVMADDKKKRNEFISNTIKLSLRTFNSECETILAKAKHNNLEACEKRIRKTFNELNALTALQEVSISQEYLELKIAELYLKYESEVKKQEEKLLKELESTKKKLEKEASRFKNTIKEIHSKLETASESEKVKLLKKLEETEPKLKNAEHNYQEIIKREESNRAGYIYILSNIGSFGEDVYKIGMTRKLEPTESINGLNDESVPFNFDMHALIFSEDALTLKENLHKRFANNQLNKVNTTKDFFKVPLSEIEAFIEVECDQDVTFIKLADAEEYKKSYLATDTLTVNSLVFGYTNS